MNSDGAGDGWSQVAGGLETSLHTELCKRLLKTSDRSTKISSLPSSLAMVLVLFYNGNTKVFHFPSFQYCQSFLALLSLNPFNQERGRKNTKNKRKEGERIGGREECIQD